MAQFVTKRTYLGMGEAEHVASLLRSLPPRRRYALPIETASSPIAVARVEHGRWLVDCPLCGSADLGDDEDPRFFCTDCRNEDAGGKWLAVQWPRDRQGIEDALSERKHTINRNWLPGETVIDLLAQTLERERD